MAVLSGLSALGLLGARRREPMRLTVRIVNQEELEFAFRMAPELMARNLNKGIKKSTLKVERESKINAPVDTGRLRASHRHKFSDMQGVVSTNVFYDIFVHEGTRYMSAQPYMKKAVESEQREVENIMQDSVQDTLDEIGRLV